jgi:hypothetical protein
MHFDSRKLGIVAGAIALAAAAVAYADSTFSEPTNVRPATTTEPAQVVVAPETETEAEDSLAEQTDARPDLEDLPPLPAANADDDDKRWKAESKVADDGELADDEVEDLEKSTPAGEEHEDDEDLDEQGDQDDDDQGENEDDGGSHEEDGD